MTTPAAPVYQSPLAWDAARPETTIITCVDGRWYHHFHEFAREYLKAGVRTDFIAVPGGIEPLTLFDYVPKDFNFFRRRLEALVDAHGTTRIVAIGHQDCAWYKQKRVGPWPVDVRERQIGDLRRSAIKMREMFKDVTVEAFFAHFAEGEPKRVVFDRV